MITHGCEGRKAASCPWSSSPLPEASKTLSPFEMSDALLLFRSSVSRSAFRSNDGIEDHVRGGANGQHVAAD